MKTYRSIIYMDVQAKSIEEADEIGKRYAYFLANKGSFRPTGCSEAYYDASAELTDDLNQTAKNLEHI